MENKKKLLHPKGREKEIMAFEYLTSDGSLNISNSISN